MKFSENSRAQTISTDAIIAVVLFTIAIIFFFALSTDTTTKRIENLEYESAKLSGEISCRGDDGEPLLNGQTVNEETLKNMAQMSCDDLKRCLGLNNNLCIYFQDDEGNLVRLDEQLSIYGIGCTDLKLTGTINCGNNP